MNTPCQQIVWELLPAIRASVAVELVKRGIPQKKAAEMLEIAPSAVSQYVSGKRGCRVEFLGDAKELVSKLVDDIIADSAGDISKRMCEICMASRGVEGSCAGDSCSD
ncbi:helix-turn-helix domain-containing protein [Methanoplanus sp. FWC-SCC4]|uniref:Helix-turn-helix domain-containing protein n=1 Tax=Methanochimaera problematica TaxID=2609417 RepID=A0AA97F9S6_9EURY|nr:helix-turn-helix domain-containing protein [Methanoplanus sp. FWC-SCC4]WOF15187.1 helix-turn-helix domain-containing protein [Methanoplanus sp. FWC-SCC4]